MKVSTPQATQLTRVLFAAPYQVQTEQMTIGSPAADQLLVQSSYSAISAGTELLFYRGQVPPAMQVDATLATLNQVNGTHYPLAYGYAAVGRVIACGRDCDAQLWLGRRVFAFQPHATHFLATPADLIPIPDDVTTEQALFLPTMETAVNFLQDGAPLLGERVVVLGQGVVGLLTTFLLARFPLAALTVVDRLPLRRERAWAMGAHSVLATPNIEQPEGSALGTEARISADLIYELTGNPAALNEAIAMCGYSGRVVIGSWYGEKQAAIDLGGHFHRNRIQLIGSQVSTIAPQLLGRWSKARRFAVAWSMLKAIEPTQLITHRFAVTAAAAAYTLLDQRPAEALQIIFDYDAHP